MLACHLLQLWKYLHSAYNFDWVFSKILWSTSDCLPQHYNQIPYLPTRVKQQIPVMRRYTSIIVQGVKSQKASDFLFTCVRTSNLKTHPYLGVEFPQYDIVYFDRYYHFAVGWFVPIVEIKLYAAFLNYINTILWFPKARASGRFITPQICLTFPSISIVFYFSHYYSPSYWPFVFDVTCYSRNTKPNILTPQAYL
jgi:hypothetical protein